MIKLEPRRIEDRLIKLQQKNKKLLMETEVLDIKYLIIDKSWDFDLEPKFINTKKIGNVNLILNYIPEWLSNIEIDGYFNCDNCGLTSLKNCPKIISGSFDCERNKLTSLEDGPTNVGLSYYNYGNDIKFTKEYVTSICNVNGYIFV